MNLCLVRFTDTDIEQYQRCDKIKDSEFIILVESQMSRTFVVLLNKLDFTLSTRICRLYGSCFCIHRDHAQNTTYEPYILVRNHVKIRTVIINLVVRQVTFDLYFCIVIQKY